MAQFRAEQLNFFYPGESKPILKEIDFTIESGDFITLCGSSGAGKSTLLRQLKTALRPNGLQVGKLYFNDVELDKIDERAQAEKIGYVLQSPEQQIVTDKVWHELAFGLESLGYTTQQIRLRTAEISQFFGIQNWFHKETWQLSGGQKQILNLAAVMAMKPEILILDEPTSQLDPIAASDFLQCLKKINQELGTTILISEHNLEEVIGLSNKVWVMDQGELILKGTAREVAASLKAKEHEMFLSMPTPLRLYEQLTHKKEEAPITIGEGRGWIKAYAEKYPPKAIHLEEETAQEIENKEVVLNIKDAWFRYAKEESDVLKGISLQVTKGEICTIMGGNGTGKTTLLSLLSGIHKAQRGKLEKVGTIVAMPQNPQLLFTRNTVKAELEEGNEGSKEKLQTLIEFCELGELLERHPYDLSGGEQQRLALAKVLLLEPQILLLDEPTKGLDVYFKAKLGKMLSELSNQEMTLIIVSHDIEFCAQYSKRCVMLFDGEIITQALPRAFFAGNNFYTTAANRMAGQVIPEAVVEADVLKAFGKKQYVPKKQDRYNDFPKKQDKLKGKEQFKVEEQETVNKKRKISLMTALSLLLIPLTIATGIYLFDDRKYYFISMLILVEIFIPFLKNYEDKKPQTREIVLISVLCTIGVIGRAAFFMVPQFKPVVALIIVIGASLGAQLGFLSGALIAFTSNFFMGQGPWTPWQMFAMGIIGYIAGCLFKRYGNSIPKVRLILFGFLATFIIYGGIMNPASVLMVQNHPTKEMILLAYGRGIPFDLIHAASTVIFLMLFGDVFLEKIVRIKQKYNLCF